MIVTAFSSIRLLAQWPSGKDGPLLVKTGEKITLQPGKTYDFQSITVQSGGTINISPGSDWVIIGSLGDVNIQGTIVGNEGIADSGNFVATAPDGFQLQYNFVSSGGGVGGDAPWKCPVVDHPIANGGPSSSNGNGGGGAALGEVVGQSFIAGGAGGNARGGDGAMGVCRRGVCSAPGQGGALWGNPGTDGGLANGAPRNWSNIGGGGGGGARGRNGQLIYIRTLGNFGAPDGIIDVSGGNGGAGGHGGDTGAPQAWVLQEGGGGGAGGRAGAIIVRYGAQAHASPLQYKVNGGQGGKGGLGGVDGNSNGHCQAFLFKGGDGQPGQNGGEGLSNVQSFKASALRITADVQ